MYAEVFRAPWTPNVRLCRLPQDIREERYREWLAVVLPRATVTVWPGSGHFPHVAYPGRFAGCLAGGGWGGSSAAIIASAMKVP
jgi:hypothetical protein